MSAEAGHGPRLRDLLAPPARRRLDELTAEISATPSAVATRFPAAARLVARGPVRPGDPSGLLGPTLEDLVRLVLLEALRDALADVPGRLAQEVTALYRFGDSDEKRAVLRALDRLDIGETAHDLLGDALRSNDPRLVAAALGPGGHRHLDQAGWRHGVLKCLFLEVPLAAVHRLAERADPELARMVGGFVVERVAAGRGVPADAWRVLGDHPPTVRALRAELRSPHADRRTAAELALAQRRDV
ncbi:EboA domain-containing protein [Marinactinospora thermotolerans]|uniref:3-methyladenine DNA glycosylase AlkD n=1 Tax=Marinactinospora thermotolerans DSM 45154 TaxID=1122192 RepID=A0A1T4SNQ2_9ACTN|nr:EboA domain-containing protein [Marinactinospora thermotolerans]SKA29869.1 hypothetical protein SAMN02745673_03781 [Marinactinospora thermotolerans DSM 45154]